MRYVPSIDQQRQGLSNRLRGVETAIGGRLAGLDAQLAQDYSNFQIGFEKANNQLLGGQNNLDVLQSQYDSGLALANNNLQYAQDSTQLGLDKFKLTSGFNVDRSNLSLQSNKDISEINKNLISLQETSQLNKNSQALSNLSSQNTALGQRLGNSQQALGALGRIGDLLEGQQPLFQQLQRSQISQSQISEEGLASAKRGLSFNISNSIGAIKAQSSLNSYYLGGSDLIASSQVLSAKVSAGVQVGDLLGKFDQANLQQQNIVTQTALRLNQNKQSLERLDVQKLNLNSSIAQIKSSLEVNKNQQQYYKDNEGLISQNADAKREKIDVAFAAAEESAKQYEQFQKDLLKINEASVVLSVNNAKKVTNIKTTAAKTNFEKRTSTIQSGLKLAGDLQVVRLNSAQQSQRQYFQQSARLQHQKFRAESLRLKQARLNSNRAGL